ncbi:autotransporter outer membrane beta-barrel domain-containing protein [Erwinia aphidicola]|nr:autotransporter outer membrane beta-barrel domain-containing protein [Erwinia aphidicola]
MRSQQAALNLVLGRTLTLESGAQIQPWLKAAAINEFVDSNPVVLNGIRFSNNPSGLRGQYGAGGQRPADAVAADVWRGGLQQRQQS